MTIFDSHSVSSTQNATRPSRVRTAIPGPNSLLLEERKQAFVSNGASSALPVYIQSAEGSVLTDVDGNQFIDMGSGIGVNTLGHVNEPAVAAAREQSGKFTHTCFSVTPYELYVDVAELLAKHTPGSFEKKSVLSTTGAEAVENAVKIARRFTGRSGVAVLDHAYHGRTNLTLGMNFKSHPYASGFGPRPGEIYRGPNSYPFRDGLSGPRAAERTIRHLEKIAGAENLACLVVEPIQGEGGFVVPADGYLEALQVWCRSNGILLIADEIQSGFGRTGKFFASEHFAIEPDLVISAKGIAAGYPLSAVTGRRDVMDSVHPGGLSGTFSGNPVACAAAIEVFRQLSSDGFLEGTARLGRKLDSGFRELQSRFSVIGDVRGHGAMQAIELVTPDGEPNPRAASAVIAAAAQRGVLLLGAGSDAQVIRFLPAVTIEDDLVDEVLHVLGEAFESLPSDA